jgi:hypothetical protein
VRYGGRTDVFSLRLRQDGCPIEPCIFGPKTL